MKYTDREFVRFILAGLVNTVVGYVFFCALLFVAKYPVAYTASYIAGIFIAYAMNCLFVFRTRSSLRSAIKYPFVYVVQYLLGISILTVLVKKICVDPKIAALVVVFFTVPVTYLLSRFIMKRTPAGHSRANI